MEDSKYVPNTESEHNKRNDYRFKTAKLMRSETNNKIFDAK